MLQRVVVEPGQIHLPHITFAPEQQHYLTRVLRLQTGDRVIVLDGQGQAWLTTLDSPTTAQVVEPLASQTELAIAVTLVIALPKGNALDDVVRQATELGVQQIQPVISDRTLLHPSPQKLERWRRIAQEATEQSERQVVPTVLEPLPWRDHRAHLSSQSPSPCAYLCTPRQSAPHLLTHRRTADPRTPVFLAIGPEGGWTDTEIDQAIAAGYQLTSLGDRILRTVTAPLVALSLIAAISDSGFATDLTATDLTAAPRPPAT